MIVTQHSGDGKANQYFLRGFNLDHGTDFATCVDGMPVNMPHARARPGLHRPELPDSRTGLAHRLQEGPVLRRRRRLLLGRRGAHPATSTAAARRSREATRRQLRLCAARCSPARRRAGPASVALRPRSRCTTTGPGTTRRTTASTTACCATRCRSATATASASRRWPTTASWNSTDQIPQRAVDQGLIGRFGAIDPSDGGKTLALQPVVRLRERRCAGGTFQTHRLRDPATRSTCSPTSPTSSTIRSTATSSSRPTTATSSAGPAAGRRPARSGRPTHEHRRLQLRHDRIDPVGLYRQPQRAAHCRRRARTTCARPASGVYVENADAVERLAAQRSLGLRADRYRFNVDSTIPQNSGRRHARHRVAQAVG